MSNLPARRAGRGFTPLYRPSRGGYDNFLFEFNGLVQQGKDEEALRYIISEGYADEYIRRCVQRMNIMVAALVQIQRDSDEAWVRTIAGEALIRQAEVETS